MKLGVENLEGITNQPEPEEEMRRRPTPELPMPEPEYREIEGGELPETSPRKRENPGNESSTPGQELDDEELDGGDFKLGVEHGEHGYGWADDPNNPDGPRQYISGDTVTTNTGGAIGTPINNIGDMVLFAAENPQEAGVPMVAAANNALESVHNFIGGMEGFDQLLDGMNNFIDHLQGTGIPGFSEMGNTIKGFVEDIADAQGINIDNTPAPQPDPASPAQPDMTITAAPSMGGPGGMT